MIRFLCLVFCFALFKMVIPAVPASPVMPVPLPAPVAPAPVPPTSAVSIPVAQATPTVPTLSVPVVPTPATPAPAPVTVAQSQNQPNNNEKEFDELYQKLNQVSVIKKELKQQLGEIEEKLDSARKMAIESKEASFKIIQQAKVEDAESLVAQVDKNLQSLSETQKKLSEIDVPKFEDSAKKIQEIMQSIQNKMAELESKGLKLQISKAQLELQKQKELTRDVAAPEKDGTVRAAVVAKPQSEKTVTQKIYDFTASTLAGGISRTKSGWQKFKKWVYSRPEESVEGKKNSKTIDLGSELAVKKIIDEIDVILKRLDDMQISMFQKYASIKVQAKNLEIRLKSNDDIRKYFESIDEQNPAWKQGVIDTVSVAVDGVYVVVKAANKTVRMVYDKLLKGFVRDVKDKIHEQDKQPNKPVEAQAKELDAKMPPKPSDMPLPKSI